VFLCWVVFFLMGFGPLGLWFSGAVSLTSRSLHVGVMDPPGERDGDEGTPILVTKPSVGSVAVDAQGSAPTLAQHAQLNGSTQEFGVDAHGAAMGQGLARELVAAGQEVLHEVGQAETTVTHEVDRAQKEVAQEIGLVAQEVAHGVGWKGSLLPVEPNNTHAPAVVGVGNEQHSKATPRQEPDAGHADVAEAQPKLGRAEPEEHDRIAPRRQRVHGLQADDESGAGIAEQDAWVDTAQMLKDRKPSDALPLPGHTQADAALIALRVVLHTPARVYLVVTIACVTGVLLIYLCKPTAPVDPTAAHPSLRHLGKPASPVSYPVNAPWARDPDEGHPSLRGLGDPGSRTWPGFNWDQVKVAFGR